MKPDITAFAGSFKGLALAARGLGFRVLHPEHETCIEVKCLGLLLLGRADESKCNLKDESSVLGVTGTRNIYSCTI